jgi:hypothetical protein
LNFKIIDGSHLRRTGRIYFSRRSRARTGKEISSGIRYTLIRRTAWRHLYQWRNLVYLTNGACATTTFAVTVEDSIRLNPYRTTSSSIGSPKLVAQALQGLAEVSCSRKRQVTIVGGDIAGWFAAVAEWLLDLQVVVCSNSGKELYNKNVNRDA